MEQDTSITLISTTTTRNAYGAAVSTETEREVMCRRRSVGRADYYNGLQSGLAQEHVFLTHPSNYAGEMIIEFEGKRYGVTRTYQSDADTLELYAGEVVGVNGSDGSGQ